MGFWTIESKLIPWGLEIPWGVETLSLTMITVLKIFTPP